MHFSQRHFKDRTCPPGEPPARTALLRSRSHPDAPSASPYLQRGLSDLPQRPQRAGGRRLEVEVVQCHPRRPRGQPAAGVQLPLGARRRGRRHQQRAEEEDEEEGGGRRGAEPLHGAGWRRVTGADRTEAGSAERRY